MSYGCLTLNLRDNWMDWLNMNWFNEHVTKLLTALILALVTLLKLYKRNKEKADIVEAVLIEKPVSQAQLVRCQLDVMTALNVGIERISSEIRTEVSSLHTRINEELNQRRTYGQQSKQQKVEDN